MKAKQSVLRSCGAGSAAGCMEAMDGVQCGTQHLGISHPPSAVTSAPLGASPARLLSAQLPGGDFEGGGCTSIPDGLGAFVWEQQHLAVPGVQLCVGSSCAQREAAPRIQLCVGSSCAWDPAVRGIPCPPSRCACGPAAPKDPAVPAVQMSLGIQMFSGYSYTQRGPLCPPSPGPCVFPQPPILSFSF